MLRPRMILFIAVGLLMTAASIVLRYHVAHQPDQPNRLQAHQPIEKPQPIIVQPLQAMPAINHEESTVEAIVPESNEYNLGDSVVRTLVEELSSHPRFAAWLVTDDLMHRFVQSVNLVAGGYSPRDELSFLGPQQPFVVDREGEQLVITYGSFHRFDLVAEVFESVNTQSAAKLYAQLAPLARETHKEVSWFAPEFDVRLAEAIDHLIETPIPSTAMTVERGAVTYAFADPSLEALTPAQKQLLRMGPHNARRIQGKLLEIRDALGFGSPAPSQIAANLSLEEKEPQRPKSYEIAQFFEGMTAAP